MKSAERKTTLNKVKYAAKNLFTKSATTSKKTKSCIKKKVVKKIPKDSPILMPTIEFTNELEHQYLYDFDLAFRASAKLYGKVTEAMNMLWLKRVLGGTEIIQLKDCIYARFFINILTYKFSPLFYNIKLLFIL